MKCWSRKFDVCVKYEIIPGQGNLTCVCVCEYEILLYACVRVDMKLWEEVRMTKHMKESFLS